MATKSKIPRSTTKRASAPVKLVEWKSPASPAADYLDTLRASVHYSGKAINSNAAAVGVRLAASDRYDGPYVAVSTVGSEKVPVDYIRGANPDSARMKQIEAITNPFVRALFVSVPAEDEAAIRAALPVIAQANARGTEYIDARLRQVLIPDGEGIADSDYVALTPLASAGFAELTHRRIDAMANRDATSPSVKQFRKFVTLGYGGANPQNVGRWMRGMGRALVFSAPSERPETKLAYAIAFGGMLPRKVLGRELDAFALWRFELRRRSEGVMPSTLETRAEEARLLQAVAHRAVEISMELRTRLARQFSENEWFGESVHPVEKALIDPRLRDASFARRFRFWILDLVKTHRFRAPGIDGEVSVGLGDDEAARLTTALDGVQP